MCNFFIVVLSMFIVLAMIQLEIVTRNNLKKTNKQTKKEITLRRSMSQIYYNLFLPIHAFITSPNLSLVP